MMICCFSNCLCLGFSRVWYVFFE